jgi:hypothetical protein
VREKATAPASICTAVRSVPSAVSRFNVVTGPRFVRRCKVRSISGHFLAAAQDLRQEHSSTWTCWDCPCFACPSPFGPACDCLHAGRRRHRHRHRSRPPRPRYPPARRPDKPSGRVLQGSSWPSDVPPSDNNHRSGLRSGGQIALFVSIERDDDVVGDVHGMAPTVLRQADTLRQTRPMCNLYSQTKGRQASSKPLPMTPDWV